MFTFIAFKLLCLIIFISLQDEMLSVRSLKLGELIIVLRIFFNFFASSLFLISFVLELEKMSSQESSKHPQLTHFEMLKMKNIKRKTRAAGNITTKATAANLKDVKELSFSAFGRDFKLILRHSEHLLSSGFKAFTVNAFNQKKALRVNYHDFYSGSLLGSLNSDVSAHIDSDTGLVTAAIHDAKSNEVFFIEPYSRHFTATTAKDKNKHLHTLLIYKASDVKFNWMRGNDSINSMLNRLKLNQTENPTSHVLERRKRSLDEDSYWEYETDKSENTRCSLLLVADYLFYESLGGKNVKQTVNYLIALISRVNILFLRTTFSDSEQDREAFTNMGFIIQEIRVHTEPTETGTPLYNTLNDSWTALDLLDVFSRLPDHRSFCLSHLFTHRNLHPTLGMAYVASPSKNAIGGICSLPDYRRGFTLYTNTGFTTTKNKFDSPIITSETDLITAHELGHNWGAEHDPDIEECSPSFGGGFIMYYFTINGRSSNNKYFSPCSRRSIKAVLKAKAGHCFVKPQTSFCGNGLVEKGEQCDAGLITPDDLDQCCTFECKLKLGAKCSDQNHPCCLNCQFIPAGFLCREKHAADCKDEAYCSGSGAMCPKSPPIEDDTDCLDRGKCKSGKCLTFCETLGMYPCMCKNVEDACKRCCHNPISINNTCVPYHVTEILGDGTPCIRGICEKGECKPMGQDVTRRIWHIIRNFHPNEFIMFAKNNMVGFIIICSLLIWIPCCCLIRRYDKKKKTKLVDNKRHSIRLIRLSNESGDSIVYYGQPAENSKFSSDLEIYDSLESK
ncbi:ADAM 17-like protease-like protein [Dinothrombium tinctorium]|uniref:ADAM 17-like protease-like protein n=1 Tax=Dinothrombium tinctorium TaxID=1965070 RepID=A0A3S3PMI4_9ACAR|nr:ADAM 17-like protease-like protein [Dinothrombium tinctorium]